MSVTFDLSLYLVLDRALCANIGMEETVRQAVAGGVTMVQLRDKEAGTAQMIETGRALQAILAGTGVPLIVNDNVDVALAIDADGVHVGQDDLDAVETRQRIGPDKILGLSVETASLAARAKNQQVDYLGAGPIFATQTKPGHKPAIGFAGLADIVRITALPIVAIGGLKAQHVECVLDTGAKGLAVVSAICGKADPQSAAQDFTNRLTKARL